MTSYGKMATICLLLCVLYVGLTGAVVAEPRQPPVPDEQRLFKELMRNYEKSVRPVINASTVLLVHFSLRLNQIIGLDERQQVLTTNVFIDQEWTDENLFWDPADYNKIKSLRVPADSVWLPDTFIYNNADDGSTGFMQGAFVQLHHDGRVLWPVPVKLKSSCKVDITYFPFDEQRCMLRFGSWIYSGQWMDYVIKDNTTAIDTTHVVNNSEWTLLSVEMQKNARRSSGVPESYPDLTFYLYIRRKTFYYIFNVIVPCVMLSILTMLTFWLPPTSGEKVTLGLSVFLAFSMFMLLIAEEVPATSEAVPLIGIYLCVVMTMTSVSVIMAVVVINLYNKGMKTKPAPAWLRKVTLIWLSKILRMRHDLERVACNVHLDEEDLVMQDLQWNHSRNSIAKSRNPSFLVNTFTASPRLFRPNQAPLEFSPLHSFSMRTCNRRQSGDGIASSSRNETEAEAVLLQREEAQREAENDVNSTTSESSFTDVTVRDTTMDGVTSSRPGVTSPLLRHEPTLLGAAAKRALSDLHMQKIMVAEWQRIAAVVDRSLFWFYFVTTLTAYVIILVVIPLDHISDWDETPFRNAFAQGLST